MKVWFDRYGDRFQGSPDPEQHYDDNKKESRILLKKKTIEKMDDPAMSESDSLLLHLTGPWLEEKDKAMSLATRTVFLDPNTCGGWQEYNRLKGLGFRGDEDALKLAWDCRRAFGAILDELDRIGHRLAVAKDQTFKSKKESGYAQQTENSRKRYREIGEYVAKRVAELGEDEMEAKSYAAFAFGVTYRTVTTAVGFCRAKPNEAA